MTMSFTARLIVAVTAYALGACESGSKPKKLEVAPLKCDIDIDHPGPLRRGGLARIEIQGAGVALKAQKVPAWCGPLFNEDVRDLHVKAGDGLLFETCLPQGIVQVSAYDKPGSGKQDLHSARQAAGVELLFNQNGGPSFSSRGQASDSIVLSADLWKANAKLALIDVATGAKVDATVEFDCTGRETGAPLERAVANIADAGAAAAVPGAGSNRTRAPAPMDGQGAFEQASSAAKSKAALRTGPTKTP